MSTRDRMALAIKLLVSHALYYSGAMALWEALALRRRAVVLMYHRVLTDEELARTGSHPAIIVRRETFDRQMSVLKRRFRVLSIEDFDRIVTGGEAFPDSACLITFDDGWRDTCENALPILQAHGLPALVFVPVNFIGTDRLFWQETLTHLVCRALLEVRHEPARRAVFEPLLEPFDLAGLLDVEAGDPRPEVATAVGRLKSTDPRGVEDLIHALRVRLGLNPGSFGDTDGFVNWTQVSAMQRGGIAIGGHGAEHRPLTRIDPQDVEAEVRATRDALEPLEEPVPAFSYPNGNWNHAIAEAVKAKGFRLAFTTKEGFVSQGDNAFALHRVNIHEDVTSSTPMFLARVLGLF